MLSTDLILKLGILNVRYLKNSHVKRVGLALNNCAASYKDKINENLQLVAMTDQRGKIVALIKVEKNIIKEAKLFDNKPISKDREYVKVLQEFAERAGLEIQTNDCPKPRKQKVA